jgi:cytochrome P450
MSYVKEMEQHLDQNIKLLRDKIKEYISLNQSFDLKKVLHYYVIDTLGELAFSQSFGLQETYDETRVPPVVEHSLLAAVTGSWPSMTHTLKRWLPIMPHKGLQQLFAGRKACADLASASVQRKLKDLGATSPAQNADRKDLLTNLISSKNPDTGEHLTQTDLETEAFGFMYEIALSQLIVRPLSHSLQYRRDTYDECHHKPSIFSPFTQSPVYGGMC